MASCSISCRSDYFESFREFQGWIVLAAGRVQEFELDRCFLPRFITGASIFVASRGNLEFTTESRLSCNPLIQCPVEVQPAGMGLRHGGTMEQWQALFQ